jgi:VWFA-related protein
MRRAVLLLAALALPAIAFADGGDQAEKGTKSAASALPADLASRYRDWLDEVAPLMGPKEREAFLALARDYQRDAFMRAFWKARDPFPKTARNELQEIWEARAKTARERYGGLTDDRARMLLFNGEPAKVQRVQCDVLLPLEIWSYDGTERIKTAFSLIFLQQGTAARLWYPSQGLLSILALGAGPRSLESIDLSTIQGNCPRGDDIADRLAEALDWGKYGDKIFPPPSEEWLSTFTSFSTDVPAGASQLPARLDLTFPSRYGSRTVVQGVVSIPREAAGVEQLGDNASHGFAVDGEVLYNNELFEHFRYRFTLPALSAAGAKTAPPGSTLPLVFQRYLRPGHYVLVLKVEDTAGSRFYREQRDLEVPAVEATAVALPPPAAPQQAAPPAPAPAAVSALAEANAADPGTDEVSVRILPPKEGLLVGKVRLEAMTSGEIGKVSFELNGKPVLTKTKPPYSVEINVGDQPKLHRVIARALTADGRQLASDELLLNAGPHRFSLRLVEPQKGQTYRESLRARAQVEVPEGESLDRVEFYLNDDLVATLFQAPFVQPILLPGGRENTYVRAVAYLKDGNSTEDLALINQPYEGDRIDVQFVELYTTVADRRGRPVEGLTRGDFKVFEDGVEQEIERFELVRDRPIYAGVMLDTSGSMKEEMDEAVKGALTFFEKVITPKDRAAVFTFADQPNLVVHFTNQHDILAGGLAGVYSEGETALYDSMIYALYHFGGLKGKRAIILLSDGADTKSRYTYNEALEYARRSGVAFYTIGLRLPTNAVDIRMKLERLAEETGGRAFFIDKIFALEGVYSKIEEELRSQYLLAYQSTNSTRDEKFREVEVKIAKPGLEAKTLRGYYP